MSSVRWKALACARAGSRRYRSPRSQISRGVHSWRGSVKNYRHRTLVAYLAGPVACTTIGLGIYWGPDYVPSLNRREFCEGPSSQSRWPSNKPVVIHRGRRFNYEDGDSVKDPEPPSQTKVVQDDGNRKESVPGKIAAALDPSLFNFKMGTVDWTALQEKITTLLIPDWVRVLPDYLFKLQKEISRDPGSLAGMIWQEANDPETHPEIIWDARVRISDKLCDEERAFIQKRKVVTRKALAKYLDLKEEDIHPDDVPTIAICGSGGGLRALVAGSSSYLCTKDAGLFDCATYTAGVSGSCWLQALFYSSITGQDHRRLIDHLKQRLGVHIAFPPAALSLLTSAPTDKYLLSGIVEKARGMPEADVGIVDIYGLLLAGRLLVPKGELGIDYEDMKLSHQRRFLEQAENPLPIYTCVRHEIPNEDDESIAETVKKAQKEAWFEWFEMTPYEFWCEEVRAGIPTWALGRSFQSGRSQERQNGLYLPEVRLSTLMGIWGSAFCASLSHYYKEVRPILKGATGFTRIDHMLSEKDSDLIKVHPIDPATVPNFVVGCGGQLPQHVPDGLLEDPQLELMDAGMSNNLPVYPLLRPGREVDILIAFDASADVKTDNWLNVVDGYVRQRGIKGWPIGAGWPPATETDAEIAEDLSEAHAKSKSDADRKMASAAADNGSKDAPPQNIEGQKDILEKASGPQPDSKAASKSPQLSFCNVWIGTTQERQADDEPPRSKLVEEDWELMQSDAGICVIYFPFLPNPAVAGVDPMTSDFMSTWNFVYTPAQIDKVEALARANFEAGRERTKRTVRAVYERKKKLRLEREGWEWEQRMERSLRGTKSIKHHGGNHFT